MTLTRILALTVAALLLTGITESFANDKSDKKTKAAEESAGWNESQMQQPATESLDLGMYNAIRDQGLEHSHIMDYAGGLIDGIGPRLTGSPNIAESQRLDARSARMKTGLAAPTRTSKTGASSACGFQQQL